MYSFFLDLNRSLDEFYDTYARRTAVETWLDAHPYQGAVPDDADNVWMAQ